jgi:hypothetical protein
MEAGGEYHKMLTIQLVKEFPTDPSKYAARDRPYLPHIEKMIVETDTSNVKARERQYRAMAGGWSYTKVIEREKFKDPKSMARSKMQQHQPMLYVTYIQCCSFVHSDPTSLQHRQIMSPIGVLHSTLVAEMIAVWSFFITLGKENDSEVLNLYKRIESVDIHEKILPKKDLPS